MINFYFFNSIIIILIFSLSKEINQIKFRELINYKNENNNINYLRNLELNLNNKTNVNDKNNNIILCNIKNCEKCEESNICLKCKNNYKLQNNHCYNTNCKIFGFCDYCDDFDCVQCIKGYQLNFGTCDKTVNDFKKKLILFILIPILLISFLIYLYIHIKIKNRKIIETGKVINLKHPQPGNYVILPETLGEDQQTTETFSKCSNLTQTNESTDDGDVKDCIVCGKKKIYAFADCGCGLCKIHWKYIKYNNYNEKINCRKHGTQLKSIVFSLDNKSNLKGNAVEKLGLKLCPVCKINNGTQSFNCECNMKICEKCFNDNVYILKYNQCPGCGMAYNPQKDEISGFRFGKKRSKGIKNLGEESSSEREKEKEDSKSMNSNI